MDRRATLSTLLGKSKKPLKSTKAAIVVTGLDPYTGTWDYELAAHLLRRTMYGPTNAQIKNAVQAGMTDTVTQLMSPGPLPSPPVNYYFEDDPNVPVGSTWIDQPYIPGNNMITVSRNRSLAAWTAIQMYEEGVSIREKMTLFWHNHFVTADVNDAKFKYNYINRLRTNALGNFRDFVKQMTIDPSILRYLNGNQNTKTAPNENYARELLELFTIGKGPIAGPGDYTNYTEDDVVAMAKVLTGWRDRGFNDVLGNPIASYYTQNRHDTTDKQLSARFDNIIISNANENEYINLIDVIFQKEEVAYFICRKLYRWFVFYDINQEVETNIIDPMAQLLIANDYEIAPVIEALMSSEHFYEETNRGCMIKNPWDFTVGVIKEMQIQIPPTLAPYYNTFRLLFEIPAVLQMVYYQAPSVAGWTAYYQAPSYYQLWANAVTLPYRSQVTASLATIGIQVAGDDNAEIDFLGILNAFENPFEINSVIDEFIQMLFPKAISQNQKDFLKEILIPGLPDFEWNVEYSLYFSDPTNETLVNAIKNKVRNLLTAMLNMPEYQLS
jgi:uncharacterized protein (DUF1800 family)